MAPTASTSLELLAGTETGVVEGYIPAFSVGATCGIDLDIVVARPADVAGQTDLGNVSPVKASGDAIDVSVVAFGDINGSVDGQGRGDLQHGDVERGRHHGDRRDRLRTRSTRRRPAP